MDLKIPAHVVKHLFKEDCLQALLLIQDLDNTSQNTALILDSDPLQAAGKAVRGGRPRHLQHHRRPLPLSESEGNDEPGQLRQFLGLPSLYTILVTINLILFNFFLC